MGRTSTTGTPKEIYFGKEEEEWFREYTNSEDQIQKDIIYGRHLKEPFEKMIDLVIKTYVNIDSNIDTFEGVKEKMYSHLGMTLKKYNIDRGPKAFSFYSNVMRNYAWQLLREGKKERDKTTSFDEISSHMENEAKYSYEMEIDEVDYFEVLITKTISEIEKELTNKYINKNEMVVGKALLEILQNRDFMYDNLGESKKYDKLFILTIIRERTNLTTTEVRLAMGRFKSLYFFTKKSGIGK